MCRRGEPSCPGGHLRDMEKVPFLDYKEVLVTGGTGFLGRHVCRALIARGVLPRLLVRTGSEERIPDDVRRACRVTPGDVTVREFVENAAQSTEAVVHLAGIIREFPAKGVTFERVHVEGTRNAVHAARAWGIRRFVHVSALGAYAGDPAGYFDSKGRAEDIVRESGLDWTIFRPAGIFGPGDSFISGLASAVRKAPLFPVPGDGSFFMQPVFVRDVVKGIVDSLARPDTERCSYDVGGPEQIPYEELADRIAASVGVRLRKVHIPVRRLRRAAGFLSRFETFPLSPEMLDVLVAGNTCDHKAYCSSFGFAPTPLSRYLAASQGTGQMQGGAGPDEREDEIRGGGEESSRSREVA